MKPWLRRNYTPDRKGWKSEYTLSKSDFTGGLNNVKPPNLIDDNECVDCKNMRIIDKAIMEKRPGTVLRDKYGDSAITWLDYFRTFSGKNIKVTANNSTVWFDDNEFSVSGKITGVTYNNRYYFVDGTCIRFYEPKNKKVYKVIEEPIAHLTGYSTQKTTENEKEIESVNKLTLDNIPDSVNAGADVFMLGISVNADKNYKTTVKSIDADTKTIELVDPLILTGTGYVIADNAPVFFYNPRGKQYVSGEEKLDDEKGIAYYLPCTQELADSVAGESYIPDSPNLITVHKNRLVVCGDSEMPHGVFISRVNQPLYFPSGTSLSVNATGEKILSLFVFDDCLIVGRHSDIFAVYGNTEYSDNGILFNVKKLDVDAGLISSDCGALLNNYYFYLGSDGRFYMMTTPTTNSEYLMTKTLGYKVDVFKSPLGVDVNKQLYVNAVAFMNDVYFAISDGTTYFVVVYSYDCMAFTYFTGWNATSLCVFDNKIYVGCNNGNILRYLYESTNNYADIDKPIECSILTKQFEPYGNVAFKYFKQFMITAYAWENQFSYIDAYIYVDINELHLKEPVSSNASVFDASIFDSNKFDWSGGMFKSFWYYIDARARTVQYRFSNSNINEGMRIYDINTIYTMRDIR